MISKTFPYLCIANKYNIEYSKVLECAHTLAFGDPEQINKLVNEHSTSPDMPVLLDINRAVGYFKQAQADPSVFAGT